MASLANTGIQKMFKEEIIPSFQKVEKKGSPPTFFYEVSIIYSNTKIWQRLQEKETAEK